MRVASRPAFVAVGLEAQSRLIERADRSVDILAPPGWTSARIEAWLDWADSLPDDYPGVALPPSLSADSPLDPLLDGGPDRHARRLAAWG